MKKEKQTIYYNQLNSVPLYSYNTKLYLIVTNFIQLFLKHFKCR